MALKSGNLNTLLQAHSYLRGNQKVLAALLKQMLEALDYLAYRRLCHRDVKPDNILYTVLDESEYLFQLADFGLATHQALAETRSGTPIFEAPEMHYHTHPQTPKLDVWSLFVTMLSATRSARFDEDSFSSYDQVLGVVKKAAAAELRALSAMAREDPTLRASAAQCLVDLFGGDGLTTPRWQIKRDQDRKT